MLGIQARNLAEQERLWKNQIKLSLREILEQELNFYQSAFQNITTCASLLGGFAFTCVAMDPFRDSDILNGVEHHQTWLVAGSFFIVLSLSTTVVCLLVVVFCNFAALFSARLALRGGATSVEDTVVKVRGEYKLALFGLMLAVELFLSTFPFVGFYKLKVTDAYLATCLATPAMVAVIWLYWRAQEKFHLGRGFGSRRNADDAGLGHLEEGFANGDVRNRSNMQRPNYEGSELGVGAGYSTKMTKREMRELMKMRVQQTQHNKQQSKRQPSPGQLKTGLGLQAMVADLDARNDEQRVPKLKLTKRNKQAPYVLGHGGSIKFGKGFQKIFGSSGKESQKKQKEADYAGSQLEQDTVEEQVGSLGSFRVPGSSRTINTPSENPALSDMRTKDITPASMSKRSANDETASSAVI